MVCLTLTEQNFLVIIAKIMRKFAPMKQCFVLVYGHVCYIILAFAFYVSVDFLLFLIIYNHCFHAKVFFLTKMHSCT
jgi:hypothetical protein